MDNQPVVCDKCTGVLLATDSRTYTTQRSRLILSNGYCTCPSAQAPAERQHPQSTTEQPAAQPQAAHTPQQNAQPTGQNSMVVA